MVCSKCQKKLQKTELATPGVKRKNDMYYGSATSISGAGNVGGRSGDKSRSSATLGNTGIGKNKLLSQKAKNPYASYASSCESCKTKTEQGRKFCTRCAHRDNTCAMCGKSLNVAVKSSKKGQPVIQGQKFNAK